MSAYHPTEDHLAKLDAGRRQAKAVRRYLISIGGRPRRRAGRPKDWDAAIERQEKIIAAGGDPLARLAAVQRRQDLQLERAGDLDHWRAQGAEEALAGFVEHGAAYGAAHRISYQAWREVGVSAKDLKAAGIGRQGESPSRGSTHD